MTALEITGKRGTDAVKRLRDQKLRRGLPFMINVEELATNQCYLEYPDGSIQLVTIVHATRDIQTIRTLSQSEANQLRRRFHFSHQE